MRPRASIRVLAAMLLCACGSSDSDTPAPEPVVEEPAPEEAPAPEETEVAPPEDTGPERGAGCEWSDEVAVDFGAVVQRAFVGQGLVAAHTTVPRWHLRRIADGEVVEGSAREVDALDGIVPWQDGNLLVAGPTIRRVDAEGMLGDTLRVVPDHDGDFRRGWLSVSGDRALLAWAQITRDRSDYELRASIVDLAAWEAGETFVIGSMDLGRSVSLAARGESFVAVWEAVNDDDGSTLRRAMVSADGEVSVTELEAPERAPGALWRSLPGVLGEADDPVLLDGMSLVRVGAETAPLLDVRPQSHPQIVRIGARDLLVYDEGIAVKVGTLSGAGVAAPFTVAGLGQDVVAATRGTTLWLAYGPSGGQGPVVRVRSADCGPEQ